MTVSIDFTWFELVPAKHARSDFYEPCDDRTSTPAQLAKLQKLQKCKNISVL